MKKSNKKQLGSPSEIGLGLEDLIRGGRPAGYPAGDRRGIGTILLEQYENVKTYTGSRAVVRNGYLP